MSFLELWRLEVQVGCQPGWAVMRTLSWVAEGQLFTVSPYGREKGSKLSYNPYMGMNPIHEGFTSGPHLTPITSQKICLLTPSHWGIGSQHTNFGRDTNSWSLIISLSQESTNGSISCVVKGQRSQALRRGESSFQKASLGWTFTPTPMYLTATHL